MIKINELRIGNYLQNEIDKSLLVVCGLRENEIMTTVSERSKSPLPIGWKAQPIPLTEEWLNKFKWERVNADEFVFRNNNYFSIDSSGRLYYMDDYTAVDIQFVHQLQNLYFALTGEELTMK